MTSHATEFKSPYFFFLFCVELNSLFHINWGSSDELMDSSAISLFEVSTTYMNTNYGY